MNQIALITGANRGLGLEWCRQLAREGYMVILTARTKDKALAAANRLFEEGLTVDPQPIELTDENSCRAIAEYMATKYEKLDILVNNAGANPGDNADQRDYEKNCLLDSLDANELLKYMHINAISPIILTKHLRKLLAASGNGKVISTTSRLGSIKYKSSGGEYSYSGSKALLNMLNRCMAFDLLNDKTTAVVVHPGWVKTDMGGPEAPLTTEQSVRGLIKNVLNKITTRDTGKFFQWDGAELQW